MRARWAIAVVVFIALLAVLLLLRERETPPRHAPGETEEVAVPEASTQTPPPEPPKPAVAPTLTHIVLAGHVYAEDGVPIASAQVSAGLSKTLSALFPDQLGSVEVDGTTTDEAGAYRLEIPIIRTIDDAAIREAEFRHRALSGSAVVSVAAEKAFAALRSGSVPWRVRASAEGYGAMTKKALIGDKTPVVLDFQLSPLVPDGTGQIAGSVSLFDGTPVPAARVYFVLMAEEVKGTVVQAIADDKGLFESTGLAPGRYYFHVDAHLGATRISRDLIGEYWEVELLPNEKVEDVELVLPFDRGNISGHVYDVDGDPIEDVHVQNNLLSTFTDARGRYLFGVVPLDSDEGSTLLFAHPEYRLGRLDDVPAGSEKADIVLEKIGELGQVTGVVVDKATEEPIPRAHVEMVSSDSPAFRYYGGRRRSSVGALTDKKGRFFLERVFAGNGTLEARAKGYAPGYAPDINIEPNRKTEGVRIALEKGGEVVLSYEPAYDFSMTNASNAFETLWEVCLYAEPASMRPCSCFSTTSAAEGDPYTFSFRVGPGAYSAAITTLTPHAAEPEYYRNEGTVYTAYPHFGAVRAGETLSVSLRGGETGGIHGKMAIPESPSVFPPGARAWIWIADAPLEDVLSEEPVTALARGLATVISHVQIRHLEYYLRCLPPGDYMAAPALGSIGAGWELVYPPKRVTIRANAVTEVDFGPR